MAFPATYNISYYSGDTYQFLIKPKNTDGSSFNIASSIYTPKFYIASSRGSSQFNVVKKSISNNIATLTTSTNHGYTIDSIITVSNVDSTFNGAYRITGIPSLTKFSYRKININVEEADCSGYVVNTIEASATISSSAYSVITKVLTSNVATLTTSTAHNYVVGNSISISGVDNIFNGTYIISAIPSTTSFSYVKTGTDIVSATVSPVGSVVSLTNTSTNVIVCTISSAIGSQLSSGTNYVYDVSILRDSNSIAYTLLTGTISVTDDITAAA